MDKDYFDLNKSLTQEYIIITRFFYYEPGKFRAEARLFLISTVNEAKNPDLCSNFGLDYQTPNQI